MTTTTPKELRIPTPWGHLTGKAWGNPENGRPVLALHGWMDNAGTFDRLAPLLPLNKLYFVAVDLPGHGTSSHLPPGIPYHFADALITIRNIVRHFKWSKLSIVGHSMGGGLAAFFASLYPSLVDRIVLLDIIKPMSQDEGVSPASMSEAIDAFLSIAEREYKMKEQQPSYTYEEALKRLILATDESLTPDSARCLLARGTIRVDEDRWAFRRDLRLRSPTIYRFSHETSLDMLKGIKCRMLLVKAKDAPVYGGPPEIVKKALEIYKEKCREFKYVEVEGNHFVHLNEPARVAGVVGEWLVEGEGQGEVGGGGSKM